MVLCIDSLWLVLVSALKYLAGINYSLILTSLLAFFGACIAWQQHKTARYKLKLDLYDRRHKVFAGLMKLLAQIVSSGSVSTKDILDFFASSAEHRFLFGDEIAAYLNLVRENALNMRAQLMRMDRLSNTTEEDRLKAVSENSLTLEWFADQSRDAVRIFEPYLGFKKVF